MKYKIAVALGLASLIIPAGIALAEDGGHGGAQGGIGVSQNLQVGLNLGLRGDADEHADASTSADVEVGEHMSATSTERNKGQRGEMERGDHATTTATTSKDHEGLGKGGIPAFLRWLFGLPATTTVGDIRTQIAATTTASTTSGSNGLGFFARLFDFFHFGK